MVGEQSAAAAHVGALAIGEAGNPLQAAVTKKMDDPSWTVRHQVAASLGEMPKDARLMPVVSMMRKYGDDDVTIDAAVSSLGCALKLLTRSILIRSIVPPPLR